MLSRAVALTPSSSSRWSASHPSCYPLAGLGSVPICYSSTSTSTSSVPTVALPT